MRFPERPTCHDGGPLVSGGEQFLIWHPAGLGDDQWGYPKRPWRHCGYCGSIHPQDLLDALSRGARLGGSDWKYGYPHKFYVNDIPNPRAGERVKTGGHMYTDDAGQRHDDPTFGPAPATLMGKWYNEHLLDEGYDEEALTALIETIAQRAGITFEIRDGQLYYRAPYYGFQTG